MPGYRTENEMNHIRNEIVTLHRKNFSQKEILKRLSHLNVNRCLVYRTILRLRKTQNAIPIKKGGRPRQKRTRQIIKVIRERIRRNPERSGRSLAREFKMHHKTMQELMKHDLGLYAYKKQLLAGLTEKNKGERVKRCKAILQRHGRCSIVFSDEKLFTLEHPLNRQNDRVYAPNLREIPSSCRNVPRFQSASAVMVFGAISERGKLPLKFIDRGVKINKDYYLKEVIEDLVHPECLDLYGEEAHCFQQDSAPAHKAKIVQAWCKANFPDFITTEEWPASSPDLNPLDFFVWGWMLQQLKSYKIYSLEQYKKVLVKIWNEMPMEHVRAACKDFYARCKLCIKAGGDRFEK